MAATAMPEGAESHGESLWSAEGSCRIPCGSGVFSIVVEAPRFASEGIYGGVVEITCTDGGGKVWDVQWRAFGGGGEVIVKTHRPADENALFAQIYKN
jgi:hypothetical protein